LEVSFILRIFLILLALGVLAAVVAAILAVILLCKKLLEKKPNEGGAK